MIENWIDLQSGGKGGEFLVNHSNSENLFNINNKIQKIKQQLEKVREDVSDKIGIDVKLVESNSHTFLLSVNKKKGD